MTLLLCDRSNYSTWSILPAAVHPLFTDGASCLFNSSDSGNPFYPNWHYERGNVYILKNMRLKNREKQPPPPKKMSSHDKGKKVKDHA